jgi:hypothetical protein
LSSVIVLTDGEPFNYFIESFSPGSSLSFLVNLTANLDTGDTPDAFAFSLLDGFGSSIPTMDIDADTLFTINIDSANPVIMTFATDPTGGEDGSPTIRIGAPIIGSTTPVPEPGSMLLLSTGLGAIGLAVWRRRK